MKSALASLRPRLENAFWSRAAPARRLVRGVVGGLWRARHRLRRGAPRVVTRAPVGSPALEPPLVSSDGSLPQGFEQSDEPARWHAVTDRELDPFDLEALLLAAAAEDLDWVEIDTAAGDRAGLVRLGAETEPSREVVGRRLARTPGAARSEDASSGAGPLPVAGSHLLRPGSHRPIIDRPSHDLERRLGALAPLEGPRTVLFLLPYLAVGGAERLLFDLCTAWRAIAQSEGAEAPRLLIVTTEPHARPHAGPARQEIGQTIDSGRSVADGVFLLGDWLPRATHAGALRHLLRRYAVETLVSWNGTTLFYDEAPALRRRFPALRIAAQLYHHEGGWAQHTTRPLVDAVDLHLAINRDLERSLVADRAAAPERVQLVHHGVEIVGEAEILAAANERNALRARLDLPEDAVVGGAFIRLHPQKRPLDLLELARRLEETPFHLLLVGDGPSSDAVDAALAERPRPNVRRLPMTPDARPLYAALDLCVLSSAYEGLPVFLLDGLARGLPAVAPAVGDIPLLLESGGGRATPPGDLDALEAAVRELLDADRRATAGERGRDAVRERFGLETSAARYRDLLLPQTADHPRADS